jgi:hypothetical protein
MLQTPNATLPAISESAERFNLSHALGIYAMAFSVPLALFQPVVLFDALRAIVATFGVKL